MKKTLIVLGTIFGAIILIFVGCSALFVGGVNEAVKETEKADSAPGGPKNPLTITEGEAFEVSGFEYGAGWSVGPDALGSIGVEGLKVTNNRDSKDGAAVEIKFWKGKEVLGLTDCTTEQIDVGTTTKVDCVSADDLPQGYDKITINDTF